MKTITVIAGSKEVREIHYAYNGHVGIETTTEDMSSIMDCVKINLWRSEMFPGTYEEWDAYIREQIEEELIRLGIAKENTIGSYYLAI